jgi:hypothetical protein
LISFCQIPGLNSAQEEAIFGSVVAATISRILAV